MSTASQTQAQRIRAAYEVLAELGFSVATVEEAAALELGTQEQRRIIRAALDKGGWDEWRSEGLRHLKNGPRRGVLALYAARAGASVKRVIELVDMLDRSPEVWNACAEVMAQRGEAAEAQYVGGFWTEFMRSSANGESALAGPILAWVAARNLELPQSIEYTKDFWAHAAAALSKTDTLQRWEIAMLPVGEDVLRPRFAEHLELTARLGSPVTGPAGPAIAGAVERAVGTSMRLRDRRFEVESFSDELFG